MRKDKNFSYIRTEFMLKYKGRMQSALHSAFYLLKGYCLMFSVGEKVVYGQTGVCVVESIAEKELIKNQKKTYYVLKPVFQPNNIIYAPTDSEKVFIRPVMTRKEANELILKIPKIKAAAESCEHSADNYRAELSSHKISDLVGITAAIYEKKQNARAQKKRLGFSDEKYMRIAEDLLFGELSVALGIPLAEVTDYISKKLENK